MDWDLIEELVSALADVAQLTTEMQRNVYMMSDFFRDLWLCRERLNAIGGSSDLILFVWKDSNLCSWNCVCPVSCVRTSARIMRDK